MQIILLQDVPKVGTKYEIKDVARGYARNFLIPRGLADLATTVAIARAEKLREKVATQYTEKVKELELYLEKLSDVAVTLKEKANEKGHLFAKIHEKEIAEALAEQADILVDPAFIVLETPLEDIGEYIIKVKVNDKEGEFKVVVDQEK